MSLDVPCLDRNWKDAEGRLGLCRNQVVWTVRVVILDEWMRHWVMFWLVVVLEDLGPCNS